MIFLFPFGGWPVIVSCKVLFLYTSILVFFDDFCLVLKFLKGFCSFSPTKRQDSQVGFVKKRRWSFWGLNLFWHLDAKNSREHILKITCVLVRKILETCYLPVEFYWELRHGQVAWHFFRAPKNCSQTFGKMVGFKKKPMVVWCPSDIQSYLLRFSTAFGWEPCFFVVQSYRTHRRRQWMFGDETIVPWKSGSIVSGQTE